MTARTHPCRGQCTTGLGGDICKGCGRTVAEIRDWGTYDPDRRQAIMRRLSCWPRKRFATFSGVSAAFNSISRRGGPLRLPECCAKCGGWHLSSPNPY